MYKEAAQKKMRFQSVRGALTTEQLFDLPLKSADGFDLDTVARTVYGQLKAEPSFVEVADDTQEAIKTSLEIVKDVIATKQAAAKAIQERAARSVQRKKILDAIAAKKDEKLTQASLEDLEKQLAELD